MTQANRPPANPGRFTSEVASRLRKDGVSLCRTMAEMVEALALRRHFAELLRRALLERP